jgi:hypothetical protein
MAAAWETISRDRRRQPRFKVSLRASVSVAEAGAEQSRGDVVLAHTRDVSREGLCLVLPSSRLGPHDLNERTQVVLIVLALPTGGSVRLEGRLAHCLPLKTGDPTAGCLAGFQITGPAPKDRAAYHDFIDSL